MFADRRKLFRLDVTINAILYIIKEFNCIDIHKVCKILYFADQEHLGKYGRTVTGDTYICMPYGPVPSNVEDIFKALRRESFFSEYIGSLKDVIIFSNKICITSPCPPDMDYLSDTDIECLNSSIEKCRYLSFDELTRMSHGFAWSSAKSGQEIDFGNILREVGASEEYIDYIIDKRESQLAFLE